MSSSERDGCAFLRPECSDLTKPPNRLDGRLVTSDGEVARPHIGVSSGNFLLFGNRFGRFVVLADQGRRKPLSRPMQTRHAPIVEWQDRVEN